MPPMIEDQIIELQTKLAYQEDAIQQLNDVIYRQQQQIDKLEKLNSELQQRIAALAAGSAAEAPQDETPPHY